MNLRRVVVTALVMSAAILSLAGCSKSTSVTSPTGIMNSTPPAAPSSLVGVFDVGQDQDYLIWSASTSPTVASYEVWQYGDNPAINTGTLVATVVSSSSYLALPAPTQNSIEYFRVRARTSTGTPSAFSATISLQRHGAMPDAPSDPGETELPVPQIH